jgi:hypothetical protein
VTRNKRKQALTAMSKMSLDFYAGSRALQLIRSGGLKAEDVEVMAGAAGGPKWLILGHLDRMIFSSWFKDRKRPLFLVGSSSGAWRFAMIAQTDPVAAVSRFEQAYIHQYYSKNPTPTEVRREATRILNTIIPDEAPDQILTHPFLRLNVMSVRCRGPLAWEARPVQMASMLGAVALNTIHRRGLGFLFDRVLFHDPRDIPPFWEMNGFRLHRVPLVRTNLRQALMASGSIPLIMPGVTAIPGAPAGTYRDGGVIDYHMDLQCSLNGGIVLFPHYNNRIIPGWLDKHLPWRKPSAAHLTDMLMVCPSKSFLAALPYGKIPDRSDFKRLQGKDQARVAYWQRAADSGKQLADGFMEAVLSDRIKELVRPLPWT